MQLGFDINEVSHQVVILADGHQRKVPNGQARSPHLNPLPRAGEEANESLNEFYPVIAPIEIVFGNRNRSYVTEAVVLGNEPLLGVIPMEAMDLIVDPRQQVLIANLQHPNYPVALAK